MSGRIERDVHSFIPSFEYQSRRLTGDRGFIDLSIFHPPSRGSRQRSGRYTEFPGTHAYVHVDTHTHTHTHIRSACTRITYTYSERFECLRGAGIHPLSFYYPLSSFCSPVLCASRERSTESDVPLLRLLK